MSNVLNITSISLDEDFDVMHAPSVASKLFEWASDPNVHTIIVNMSQTRYIDSTGLGVLISLKRTLRDKGKHLRIVNARHHVARILALARMFNELNAETAPTVVKRVSAQPYKPAQHIISLRVAAHPQHIADVRARISRVLQRMALPEDVVFDMTLAVGEALGNAWDHGQENTRKDTLSCEQVYVTISVYDDRIIIEITDRGCGNFTYISGKDTRSVPADYEMRGRGILLMEMLSDALEIKPRRAGQGTVVTLVKCF